MFFLHEDLWSRRDSFLCTTVTGIKSRFESPRISNQRVDMFARLVKLLHNCYVKNKRHIIRIFADTFDLTIPKFTGK